ncbi:Uncharacterised protein g8512 [Pycnogonum litorale]
MRSEFGGEGPLTVVSESIDSAVKEANGLDRYHSSKSRHTSAMSRGKHSEFDGDSPPTVGSESIDSPVKESNRLDRYNSSKSRHASAMSRGMRSEFGGEGPLTVVSESIDSAVKEANGLDRYHSSKSRHTSAMSRGKHSEFDGDSPPTVGSESIDSPVKESNRLDRYHSSKSRHASAMSRGKHSEFGGDGPPTVASESIDSAVKEANGLDRYHSSKSRHASISGTQELIPESGSRNDLEDVDGDGTSNSYNYDDDQFEEYSDNFEDESGNDDEGRLNNDNSSDEGDDSSADGDTAFGNVDHGINRNAEINGSYDFVANNGDNEDASNRSDDDDERHDSPRVENQIPSDPAFPKIDAGKASRDSSASENNAEQRPASTTKKNYMNFGDAKKRYEQKKVDSKAATRAAEVLELITLDVADADLLDMPPVQYDVYIRSFGRLNTKQAYVQTDNKTDEEMQTDGIEFLDKWTQCPAHDHRGYGGDLGLQDEIDQNGSSWEFHVKTDILKLNKFLNSVTPVFVALLQEQFARSQRNNLIGNQANISFSDGFVQLVSPSFRKGSPVTFVHCLPNQENMLITIHGIDWHSD